MKHSQRKSFFFRKAQASNISIRIHTRSNELSHQHERLGVRDDLRTAIPLQPRERRIVYFYGASKRN